MAKHWGRRIVDVIRMGTHRTDRKYNMIATVILAATDDAASLLHTSKTEWV